VTKISVAAIVYTVVAPELCRAAAFGFAKLFLFARASSEARGVIHHNLRGGGLGGAADSFCRQFFTCVAQTCQLIFFDGAQFHATPLAQRKRRRALQVLVIMSVRPKVLKLILWIQTLSRTVFPWPPNLNTYTSIEVAGRVCETLRSKFLVDAMCFSCADRFSGSERIKLERMGLHVRLALCSLGVAT